MKESLVLYSFFKQRARQLKKEKILSLNQALNEAAKELGYDNYKNYLNLLNAKKDRSHFSTEDLIRKISFEKEMSKKMDLAIPFIQNYKSFRDLLGIIKIFQESEEHLKFLCDKTNLKNEIQEYFFNSFTSDEGKAEIEGFYQHYEPKSISLSNFSYEIDGDSILIDGCYDLIIQFEFEVEFEDDDEADKEHSHFEDHMLFGHFEIAIDKNKKITILNSSIAE